RRVGIVAHERVRLRARGCVAPLERRRYVFGFARVLLRYAPHRLERGAGQLHRRRRKTHEPTPSLSHAECCHDSPNPEIEEKISRQERKERQGGQEEGSVRTLRG